VWRFLFIAFLIVHAGIHLAIWLSPPRPDAAFDPNSSWLLGSQRGLAVTLAVIAAALLVVGGVGLWMEGSWWRVISVTGLAVSFLLMVLFFQTWFIPIQVINAALIVALLWLDWPSEAMVGA
jgi:hypothetical protein